MIGAFRIGPAWRPIEARAAAFQRAKNAEPQRMVAPPTTERFRRREAKALLLAHRAAAAFRRCKPASVIIEEVAAQHSMSVRKMLSPDRKQYACRARNEAAWRIYSETRLSLPQIGRLLNGRDHTTIIHAIERHMDVNGIAERPQHRVIVSQRYRLLNGGAP